MKLTERYEFDAKFWAISVCLILLLTSGFVIGKKMVDRYRGKQVQELLTRSGLDTPKEARRQAKAFVQRTVAYYRLTSAQGAKLEDIYTEAILAHLQIWRDDRMKGLDIQETRRKQAKIWSDQRQKEEAYLESLGKKPR